MRVDGLDLSRLNRMAEGDTLKQRNDGAFVGTVVYYCDWKRVFELMPRRNISQHPDFNNMICSDVAVRKEKPLVAKITATYTGSPGLNNTGGGAAGNEKVYEIINTTTAEPIESHPDFETFAGTAENPNGDNGAKFDSDGIFIGFGDPTPGGEFLKHVTDYLVPSVTWSESYIQTTAPTSLVGIGTKNTPTDAPAIPDDREWLKTQISWRKTGGVYEVNEQWLLSGERGWSDTLYNTT